VGDERHRSAGGHPHQHLGTNFGREVSNGQAPALHVEQFNAASGGRPWKKKSLPPRGQQGDCSERRESKSCFAHQVITPGLRADGTVSVKNRVKRVKKSSLVKGDVVKEKASEQPRISRLPEENFVGLPWLRKAARPGRGIELGLHSRLGGLETGGQPENQRKKFERRAPPKHNIKLEAGIGQRKDKYKQGGGGNLANGGRKGK